MGYLTRFRLRALDRRRGDRRRAEQRLRASGLMTPLDLAGAGRWWVTLAIALAIVALARCVPFGIGTALAATLFVAWSPYFAGLSRQLHPTAAGRAERAGAGTGRTTANALAIWPACGIISGWRC
ncbi:MAG: hypothetical protein R2851_24375 [Caldilineaceae bacterium]